MLSRSLLRLLPHPAWMLVGAIAMIVVPVVYDAYLGVRGPSGSQANVSTWRFGAGPGLARLSGADVHVRATGRRIDGHVRFAAVDGFELTPADDATRITVADEIGPLAGVLEAAARSRLEDVGPMSSNGFTLIASGWPTPVFTGIAWRPPQERMPQARGLGFGREVGERDVVSGILTWPGSPFALPLRPRSVGILTNGAIGLVLGGLVGLVVAGGRRMVREAEGQCPECGFGRAAAKTAAEAGRRPLPAVRLALVVAGLVGLGVGLAGPVRIVAARISSPDAVRPIVTTFVDSATSSTGVRTADAPGHRAAEWLATISAMGALPNGDVDLSGETLDEILALPADVPVIDMAMEPEALERLVDLGEAVGLGLAMMRDAGVGDVRGGSTIGRDPAWETLELEPSVEAMEQALASAPPVVRVRYPAGAFTLPAGFSKLHALGTTVVFEGAGADRTRLRFEPFPETQKSGSRGEVSTTAFRFEDLTLDATDARRELAVTAVDYHRSRVIGLASGGLGNQPRIPAIVFRARETEFVPPEPGAARNGLPPDFFARRGERFRPALFVEPTILIGSISECRLELGPASRVTTAGRAGGTPLIQFRLSGTTFVDPSDALKAELSAPVAGFTFEDAAIEESTSADE